MTALPTSWNRDPFFADDIYRRMRHLNHNGHSATDIARIIGCHVRTVHRFRAREAGRTLGLEANGRKQG